MITRDYIRLVSRKKSISRLWLKIVSHIALHCRLNLSLITELISFECFIHLGTSDPYNPDERDPALTKALESSLWEVQLLGSHVVPAVSAATNFMKELPKVEIDLGPLLETTTDEVRDLLLIINSS